MILVVDDDAAIRSSISLMLKVGGYESRTVSNENDALAELRRKTPRLVILDMNLTLTTTGRQGIELLRKIRVLAPDTSVILISAWATVPLAVEGMGYGASDFVTKPWVNKEFMAKIRKALATAEENERMSGHVDTLETVERNALIKALRQADGNIATAAESLGITRQALYRRMEKYGIK